MAVALRQNNYGHFRKEHGENRQIWALRARCFECKETEDVNLSGGKSSLPQDFADRGFRNRGWFLGKDRDHDRCPKCIEKEVTERRAAQDRAVAAMPPVDINLFDPIPAIPQAHIPRVALQKPIDWLPTQEEITAYLRDGGKAVGSNPKARRDSLTWYPSISRGGESFIRDVIETRISKNEYGLFSYDGHWNDANVTETIAKLYPAFPVTRDMVRQVRTQFFGPSNRRLPTAGMPKAIPAPPPEAVVLYQPPEAPPMPQPTPAPVSAPENKPAGDLAEKRLGIIEKDLTFLFEEFEKAKVEKKQEANVLALDMSVMADRLDRFERQMRGDVEPAKAIEDYSITELLAEIGRRTSQAQPAVLPAQPLPAAPKVTMRPYGRAERAPTGPEVVFATIATGKRKFRNCADALEAAGLARSGTGALLSKMQKRGQLVQDKHQNFWRPDEQPHIVAVR